MSDTDQNFDDRNPAANHTPLMRTVLSQFCDEFGNDFQPLLNPVQQAAEALAAAPQDVSARSLLPSLRDLRHQMQTLIDKVAEQQAYVLIFGPLKSGKSTFMNALSAAYVSEVTSLPAYPCMVYVSHTNEPAIVVTHYDGRTATFTQQEALHEVLSHGHRQLTRRIREVEGSGEVFDPAVHMPDAIRKIDIKINIPDLAGSGAVLVDTPGLYSRMKFGYDRMTRDFRNAAACAIFVVKTDNLFLEQVFDEFSDLLELFSRIFLVVNIDSAKKDLLPDGTLTPSLEHQDPWEVIEAFKTLSMTAPLKEAADDGRLSIYPVDLLNSASRRILAGNGSAMDETEDAKTSPGEANFNALLSDLTDFLNSNEYLKAFLDDSLRRSRSLATELQELLEHGSVDELDREIATLNDSRDEVHATANTVERLQQVEWRDQVQGLGPWLLERVNLVAGQVKTETIDPVTTAIDQWFDHEHSLNHLLEQDLLGIFASAQTRLVRDAEDALKLRASEDVLGLSAMDELRADLRSVDIDLAQTAEAALSGLKAGAAVSSPRPDVSVEAIPVRRKLGDWLLLRSGISLRRRIFGLSERPDNEIPPQVKAERLGSAGRDMLRDSVAAQLEAMIDGLAANLPDQLVRGYAERFNEDLQAQLQQTNDKAKQRYDDVVRRLSDTEDAQGSLATLSETLGSVSSSLYSLTDRFSKTDPETLTQQAV